MISRKFIICLFLFFLLQAAIAQAAGGKQQYPWSDSLSSIALDAELSLQEILNDLGYSVNVATDEITMPTFTPPAGSNLVEVTLLHAGIPVNTTAGWYADGDNWSKVQLFGNNTPTGSSNTFAVTPGMIFGIYHGPTYYEDYWYTQSSLNWEDYDHFKVFPAGENQYIIAVEDLPQGGDQDFNDYVLQLAFLQPGESIISFSGETSYLFCYEDSICFTTSATGAGNLTLSIVEDGIPTVVASGLSPLEYEHCILPWPIDSTHTFAFQLESDEAATVYDTFTVDITMQSRPILTIDPNEIDTTVCGQDTICIDVVSAFDPDGDDITFELYSGDGVINPVTGEICFLPDQVDSAEYRFIVRATDPCCASKDANTPIGCPRDTLLVRVKMASSLEIITINDTTLSLCEPQKYCFDAYVVGESSTGLTITCGAGFFEADQLCFDADTAGIYSFCLEVEDNCGNILTDTVTITLELNLPPTAFAGNDNTITQCGSDPICWAASCDDPDGNLLSCELISGIGTYNGSEICFTPTGSGDYQFILQATDECAATALDTVIITIEAGQPPTVNVGDTAVVLCEPEEICIPAVCDDPDGDLVSCQLIFSTSAVYNFSNDQICFTPDTAGTYLFVVQATDLCGGIDVDTGTVVVELNLPPQINPGNTNIILCEADSICVTVNASDPDNNFTISTELGVVNGNQVCIWSGDEGQHEYYFDVIVTDECGAADTAEYRVAVLVNSPPVIIDPNLTPQTICAGEQFCFQPGVTDSLIANLTWTILSGEGSINPQTGEICFTPTLSGNYAWQITVTDSCGVSDQAAINLQINVVDVPTAVIVPSSGSDEYCFGENPEQVCIQISYDDSQVINSIDVESSNSIVDYTFSYNAGSGELCFEPLPDLSTTYHFTFTLTNECDEIAQSVYSHSVDFLDCDSSHCLTMAIEQTDCITLGSYAQVNITIAEDEVPIGGFDLLIHYDVTAFTPMSVSIGSAIDGWEYFNYNFGPFGYCQSCPSGLIKIVAIADINNGANHPPGDQYTPDGVVATIRFLVTSNSTFAGYVYPVSFYWFDCGDNGVSSMSGDTLFVDQMIYNPEFVLWDESDNVNFPEGSRPQGLGVPDSCIVGTDKNAPVRCIDFWNGYICIIHNDSIDARGDINLNAIANEIADQVVFTNYFLFGISAFTISINGQVAATDVNNDGITLTIGDLVYLLRVITGDAIAIPKLSPWNNNADIVIDQTDNLLSLSTNSESSIGALHARIELGSDDVVDLIKSDYINDMELEWAQDGNMLNLILYSTLKNVKVPSGVTSLFSIQGSEEYRITHIEAADYYGNMINLKIEDAILPDDYSLRQNYPNPFNPETQISFYLPNPTEWKLTVFNINGRVVKEYQGIDNGEISVTWDGSDLNGEKVATGLYLYRLDADDYSATRKMMLLK